ncbi:FUSC family protein [Cellulosimicrobium cellulans]|nr:FUSC family protein [Cellulosimicrobium cellulans]
MAASRRPDGPPRVAQTLTARDPGRTRLTSATVVSAGVLCSAVLALEVVRRLQADPGYLAMAVFLSVQAGNVVQDRTPRARAGTALLLVPTVATAIAVATLLSAYRPALLAVFVALTGAATWVRRYGPRAAAIGMLAFMGYLFTLFMRPTAGELPAYCLIAVGAVATQAAARALLRLEHPRRTLLALLAELRIASAAALRSASHPVRAGTLRTRLARIDAVGRALTSWQQDYSTSRHVGCSERSLARLVLDARVCTEETCDELVRAADRGARSAEPADRTALAHLEAVLGPYPSGDRIESATAWATRTLSSRERPAGDGVLEYLVARSTLAHARLRRTEQTHGTPALPDDAPVSSSAHARTGVGAAAPPRPARPSLRRRWTPWRQWAPTSRLAVQAMIAAAAAAAVGEAISASRWYWAVMSAFVIFAGTTTRGGVLTRAYRRVAGTAGGIVVGVGAVLVAHQHTSLLVGISVAAVFGMLYLGPVSYVYTSFFMTVVVVAIYAMLGVLRHDVLELRLEETLAGAVIGVLCAYLILSASSHPALAVKVSAYFQALDGLLQVADRTFGGHGDGEEALAALHDLEAARDDVDQTLEAMSTALLGRHVTEVSAVHLMYVATRACGILAQAVMARGAQGVGRHGDGDLVVQDAIAVVRRAADATRGQLDQARDGTSTLPASVISRVHRLPSDASGSQTSALFALGRVEWALRRLAEIRTRPPAGTGPSPRPEGSGSRRGPRGRRRAPTTAPRHPTSEPAGARRRRER